MACSEHDTRSETDTAQSEQPIEWNQRDSDNATYTTDDVTQTEQPTQQMSMT